PAGGGASDSGWIQDLAAEIADGSPHAQVSSTGWRRFRARSTSEAAEEPDLRVPRAVAVPSPVPDPDLDEVFVGGTLAYMAPERLTCSCSNGGSNGLAPGVDARADQFSLSVTAWEALYGTRPFPPGVVAMVGALATGRLQPGRRPADAPRRLRSILRRGLAEDPDRRWPTVGHLARALERLVDGRRRRRCRRLSSSLALGCVALASIAALTPSDGTVDTEHQACRI
ncbi:MAG: hypothetical protein KC457_35715, partial [Myxococcales bacterium]|nr:hypothetical protein [Myxococcales bacterium]